jgi:hypothetical protein
MRIPARPGYRVPQAQRKAVAELGRHPRQIATGQRIAKVAEEQLAPPVADLQQQPAVAARGIAWPQQMDVGGVLDQPPVIARRRIEQRDAPVGRVVGIDLATGRAEDPLPGPGVAKDQTIVERLDPLDGDVAQHRRGRCRPQPAGAKLSSTPTPSGS